MHRDAADLVEVPFANGLLPWGKTVEGPTQGAVFAVRTHNSIQVYINIDDIVLRQEVELPALSSVAAVEHLNTPQTYCYFEGYYPDDDIPTEVATCKKKILFAIGRPLDAQ